jgi:hypothetical protein
MRRPTARLLVPVVASLAAAVVLTGVALADSTPVGPLPSGPTSTIQTQTGQLVAVALPRRAGGRVWRIARAVDPAVLRQVSEADVGASVVVVFRATGAGTATISFGLTRGETAKAYESRRFTVHVRRVAR